MNLGIHCDQSKEGTIRMEVRKQVGKVRLHCSNRLGPRDMILPQSDFTLDAFGLVLKVATKSLQARRSAWALGRALQAWYRIGLSPAPIRLE
jgi:hypothetical protein